jgi:hypothetical protein
VTGASIDGSTIVLGASLLSVQRIFDFTTSYTAAELQAINTVQDQANLLLLHGSLRAVADRRTGVQTPARHATRSSTWATATFNDGPYMDPVSDGATITPQGTSGSVTATIAGGTTRWTPADRYRPHGPLLLRACRVGHRHGLHRRAIGQVQRGLLHRPEGEHGQAAGYRRYQLGRRDRRGRVDLGASSPPFTSTTIAVATIKGDALPRTTACTIWRLGLYSDTTGYPTCGAYHEGRLWLAGAVGNRADASNSNDLFNFAPTSSDGTVADSNGIAVSANSDDVNAIFWMISDESGLICGTQGGEWRIRSSSSNDPITPTSIQFKRVTKFGCANVPAKRTGNTITFVERYNKKVIEYITTDARGLSGNNISLSGKHLTQLGVSELAYQREKVPVIWARTTAGQLIGCTYKRESPYADQPAEFSGWHAHTLGDGLTVQSIQVGPNFDGTLDTLSMVVFKQDTGFYYSHLLTDLFDVDWTIGDAMYVDFGTTPAMGQVITSVNPHVIRFYSLHRLAGQTVDAFIGGVDFSGLVVAADGTLDVPLDNAGNLLTSAWIAALTTTTSFHGLGLRIQLTPADVAATPPATGMLEFDTSLGGDGNGVAIPSWDYTGGPRLFTSSAATGACALWDMTAQNTPPTRLAFHATNAVQGLSVGDMDTRGNVYLGGFASISKLTADLQTLTTTTYASLGINAPTSWIAVKIGTKDYLVSVGGQEVSLINVFTAPAFVGKASITDPVCSAIGRVKQGSTSATLWLLAASTTSGGSFTRQGQNLALWKVVVNPTSASPVVLKRIVEITPAMFGAWTHISANVDLLGDETDGNPIIWAQSTAFTVNNYNNATAYLQYDCVSYSDNHDYEAKGATTGNVPAIGGNAFWRDLGVHQTVSEQNFIKITRTGAVMWSAKMTGGLLGFRQMSRVRYGKLRVVDVAAHASSNHWLFDIATLTNTGAVLAATSDLWDVSPSFSKQFYNDTTGQWICNLGYVYLLGQPGSPIPQGATASTFTTWGELVGLAAPYYPMIAPPNAATFQTVPAAIGYTYTTQCQILRALAPDESGARNGPALGKSRRTHMYAALVQQTQGVQFGLTFDALRLHKAGFATKGGTPYALTSLFSGVHKAELEGDSDFDNMLCWQILRPYPTTVTALEGFLHTQDR